MKIKYNVLTVLCFVGIYLIGTLLYPDTDFEDIESI